MIVGSPVGSPVGVSVGSPIERGGRYSAMYTFFDADAVTPPYLTRATNLDGSVDGDKGTFSGMIKPVSTLVTQYYLAIGSNRVIISRLGTGEFQVQLRSTGGALWTGRTVGTYLTRDEPYHVHAAWDLSGTPSVIINVDGVADTSNIVGPVVGDVEYTNSPIRIGASSTAAFPADACLSEMYLNTTEYEPDPTKFANGSSPKNLGTNGRTPTGTQPIFYMPDPLNGVNLGSGGSSFTEVGTLERCDVNFELSDPIELVDFSAVAWQSGWSNGAASVASTVSYRGQTLDSTKVTYTAANTLLDVGSLSFFGSDPKVIYLLFYIADPSNISQIDFRPNNDSNYADNYFRCVNSGLNSSKLNAGVNLLEFHSPVSFSVSPSQSETDNDIQVLGSAPYTDFTATMTEARVIITSVSAIVETEIELIGAYAVGKTAPTVCITTDDSQDMDHGTANMTDIDNQTTSISGARSLDQALNVYGIKATHFVEPDVIDTANHLTAAQLAAAVTDGHNLQITSTAILTSLTQAQIEEKIDDAQAVITTAGGGTATALSYQNGAFNADAIAAMQAKGVTIARSIRRGIEPLHLGGIVDIYNVSSEVIDSKTPAQGIEFLDWIASTGSVYVFYLHDGWVTIGELETFVNALRRYELAGKIRIKLFKDIQ